MFEKIIFRHFQILCTLFVTSMFVISVNLLRCFTFRLFDESLRWLMANGRLGEAEKVVRKAAKMNKLSFDQVIGIVKAKMREMEALDKENGVILVASDSDAVTETYIPKNTEVKKYSMIDILRDRLILINSIVIWFVW